LLQVELQDNGLILDVTCNYHRDYIDRLKQVAGARYHPEDKKWTTPVGSFDDFEELFKGEIVYITPRHKILGETPPPPPQWYYAIPKDSIPDIKLVLYKFQEFGANFLAYRVKEKGFALLCDDVGLGKTPSSLGAAQKMIADGNIKNVLIVCLNSLKGQWIREGINKFTYESSVMIDGTPKKRAKIIKDAQSQGIRYTVINYDLLRGPDLDALIGKYDLIICDEIHYAKNYKGVTNLAMCKLKPKYWMFLTGTPMMNRPDELFGIFQIADPKVFGKFSKFSKRFIKYAYTGRFNEFIGYRHLDELHDEVGEYILRRTAEEVEVDLPDVITSEFYVDPTPVQIALIKAIDEQMSELQVKVDALRQRGKLDEADAMSKGMQGMLNLKIGASSSPELFTMSKSESVTKTYSSIVKRDMSSPKLDLLKELVSEIVTQGDKIVIFTKFERMTQILRRELSKITKCLTYTGKYGIKEKDIIQEAFRNDTTVKILIGTEAMATGLNLEKGKYVINYDLPWGPATYTQRNGRIRRINSKFKKVFVYNLMTRETLDEAVYAAIKKKQNLANALYGNSESQSKALKELMN